MSATASEGGGPPPPPPPPPILSSNFDGGNGEIIKAVRSSDGSVIEAELTIRKEPFTEGTCVRALLYLRAFSTVSTCMLYCIHVRACSTVSTCVRALLYPR